MGPVRSARHGQGRGQDREQGRRRPESQKVYIRRHNEELARRVERDKLAKQFAESPATSKSRDSDGARSVLLSVLQSMVEHAG